MRSAPAETLDAPHWLARDAMVRELLRPLREYLAEDGVTEIIINRPGEVFLENGPEWRKVAAPHLTLSRCLSLANAIATYTEQEIGPSKPILSAMLPDGERVQIVVPPAVEVDTVSLSIRRPSASIKTLAEYEASGAFARYMWARPPELEARKNDLDPVERKLAEHLDRNNLSAFLTLAVQEKKNIAFVGNTGSGKTTLMKTVCQDIPRHERIITIEDVRELFLPHHPNRVHLLYSKGGQGVARVTPSDLIASNMRMKPDRVLLAELRGGEAFDFLKLLTTGHSGSVTSFHAESCALAMERYVFMAKEHEQAAIYDAASLKHLVALTLDVIVHVIARTVYDKAGVALKKERYVAEVHFDPIAKLRARFGAAEVHRAVREAL
jgi:type IV secretion system protein VirB11